MPRVTIHRDRVRIQGNPHRLRTDEIEYLVRAVLWRLAAEGPKERREWRRWAEANRPGPLVWGEEAPLTYTIGDVAQVRRAA